MVGLQIWHIFFESGTSITDYSGNGRTSQLGPGSSTQSTMNVIIWKISIIFWLKNFVNYFNGSTYTTLATFPLKNPANHNNVWFSFTICYYIYFDPTGPTSSPMTLFQRAVT